MQANGGLAPSKQVITQHDRVVATMAVLPASYLQSGQGRVRAPWIADVLSFWATMSGLSCCSECSGSTGWQSRLRPSVMVLLWLSGWLAARWWRLARVSGSGLMLWLIRFILSGPSWRPCCRAFGRSGLAVARGSLAVNCSG